MVEMGRILLADDELSFLEATGELLRRAGYACDCVTDALGAAHLLRQREYDLLIADIQMPGNSNLSLLREVPGMAPGLPVILVTGHPSPETVDQSAQLAVVAYLIKPFEFEQLLAAVAPAVERSQHFRFARKVRQRLQDLQREVEKIEKSINANSENCRAARTRDLMTIAQRRLIESLNDLQRVAEALAWPPGKKTAVNSAPMNHLNA